MNNEFFYLFNDAYFNVQTAPMLSQILRVFSFLQCCPSTLGKARIVILSFVRVITWGRWVYILQYVQFVAFYSIVREPRIRGMK